MKQTCSTSRDVVANVVSERKSFLVSAIVLMAWGVINFMGDLFAGL